MTDKDRPEVEDMTAEEYDARAKTYEESSLAIRYRIAPRDLGYDLRDAGEALGVIETDDPLVLSYRDAHGHLRVVRGPQRAVIEWLRDRGYTVRLVEG